MGAATSASGGLQTSRRRSDGVVGAHPAIGLNLELQAVSNADIRAEVRSPVIGGVVK